MKPALLLLHGALGTKAQFDALMPLLNDDYEIHRLDFEGHGAVPGHRPFRVEHFAENVLTYLNAQAIRQAHIFGYSLGGYVALYLALTQPDRVSSVFTLATKLAWTAEAAAKEVASLDADKILAKVPRFAEALQEKHGERWRDVLDKTKTLLLNLGEQNALTMDDLGRINCRTRIGVGDRDATVSLEECVQAYRALPNGELQVFPDAKHPLETVDVTALAAAVKKFIELA